jgi:hypothetical protein
MKKDKKPFAFTAREELFTVQLDRPCVVTGYTEGNKFGSFYKPIPVKKGDTFKHVEGIPHGITLNGVFVPRRARPAKDMVWKVAWVAKKLRVAVFLERDRIYSRRKKKWTNKYGRPYWTACDLRSYNVGCDKDAVTAIKNLILQCQATNLCAEEEKAKGHGVIRWRCLLKPEEVKEMERKAHKTGFILDGVEVPPLPKKWQEGLKKLKAARK